MHCPELAFIGNIGIMLCRDSRSLRINVKRLQPDALISYLQRLGWQGETDELETLMARLFTFSDLITVCLDIGRKVRSRIGFECAIREQHPPLYHWDVFLDYLVTEGLCEPCKRAALLDWPGHTSPMSAEASWPDHLIAAALLKPQDHLGVFDRELSHIKIVWQPQHALEAKAYLWYQHRWLTASNEKRSTTMDFQSIVVDFPGIDR